LASKPAKISAPAAPFKIAAGSAPEQVRLLQWLVFLRVVVAFFILGSTYVLYGPRSSAVVYGMIGVNVLITLLSATLIERKASSRLFVLFQIYWDFLFVTVLVYFTGSFFSLFSFLYVLTIIYAGIFIGRGQSIFIAFASSVAYAAVLCGQLWGVWQPFDLLGLDLKPPTNEEVFVKILLNALAYFASGMMASYLAARTQAASLQLQRQTQEMEDLRILNKNIVQSLPIGLITCDRRGVVIFANEAVQPILGRGDPELRGRRLGELLPPLGASVGHVSPMDVDFSPDSDRRSVLSITAHNLRDAGGQVAGRVVTLQDVTALRELEQAAKQADRQAAIGKLAAGMAHEIRNPLASMSGAIQLLQSELQLDPIHTQLMNIVMRETDRLNKLINEFLTYARPAQRHDSIADLSEILAEQLGVLAHDPAVQDRIVIESDLQKNLICRFDPDQIRQLFWNLCLNAVQAMDDGPGALTVVARFSTRYPGYAEVEVRDTGKGIDKDIMGSIFDPFFTTKEKGTGLGLTIAYRIVENHNGKIFVDSPGGGGAVFHVLLPSTKDYPITIYKN
jgi:two-component system sensor histidine kinase PilS (NtrC family)